MNISLVNAIFARQQSRKISSWTMFIFNISLKFISRSSRFLISDLNLTKFLEVCCPYIGLFSILIFLKVSKQEFVLNIDFSYYSLAFSSKLWLCSISETYSFSPVRRALLLIIVCNTCLVFPIIIDLSTCIECGLVCFCFSAF